ncbi:acyl carrier protein [bacterium]|nr:MAG: acyl carrier protein [bacterium]
MADTLERVKALFIEKLEIKAEALTPEATLESLGLDSLDKIEFVFTLEDEFKISFPERKIELNTVQDVINIIDKLIAEKQAKA